jgi:putative flippase GtrA
MKTTAWSPTLFAGVRAMRNAIAGRPEVMKLIRFGVSGVLATGLHVAIALSLINGWATSAPLANSVAFAGATVWSYLANTLWSFSSRPDLRNACRFAVVALGGMSLTALVAALAQRAGAAPLVGIGAVVSVVPGFTFVAHRYWTYRRPAGLPAPIAS